MPLRPRTAFAASLARPLAVPQGSFPGQRLGCPAHPPRRRARRLRCPARAQQSGEAADPDPANPGANGARARRERESAAERRAQRDEGAEALLGRLGGVPGELDALAFPDDTAAGRTAAGSRSLLHYAFTVLPGEVFRDTERALSHPYRIILASSISLLLGFFMATSISVIIVSIVEWDTIWAAILLAWIESYTRWYYSREKPPARVFQLLNAFKIGIIYGLAVDAFKVGS